MAKFRDLPPEVLMQIAKDIHPGDIVNFALLNRKVYYSIHDSLQTHHDRMAEHHTVNDESIEFYRRIAHDPSELWYIRTFVSGDECRLLDKCSSQELADRQKWLDDVRYGREQSISLRCGMQRHDMDIVMHSMLRYSDFATLSQVEYHDWKMKFVWLSKSKLSYATFAVLTFACNLTTLVISAEHGQRFPNRVGDRESPLVQSMNLAICAGLTGRLEKSVFPNLRKLRINHGHALRNGRLPFLVRVNRLQLLLLLPALEVFSIATFGGKDSYPFRSAILGSNVSKVRHLDLGLGTNKPTAWANILRMSEKLESFRMLNADISIVWYLLKYHGKTLNSLNLGCRAIEHSSHLLPSLLSLSVLTTLRIDYEFFFERTKDGGRPCNWYNYTRCLCLRSVLPRSLRKLRIKIANENSFARDDGAFSQMLFSLDKLVRARKNRIPYRPEFRHLKGICISCCMYSNSIVQYHRSRGRQVNALQKLCDLRGVVLSKDKDTCSVCDEIPRWLDDDRPTHGRCLF